MRCGDRDTVHPAKTGYLRRAAHCASSIAILALSFTAVELAGITASSSATTLLVGAPATAGCNASGGKETFEYPIGISDSASDYVAPATNKGEIITVRNIHLSCTSPQVPNVKITGLVSGKGTITEPSESSADFYNCGFYSNDVPPAGGTFKGKLTVVWTGPNGLTLSPSTSTIKYDSIAVGIMTVSGTKYETYSYPGAGSVTVTGAFPGTEGGTSSTMMNLSKDSWSALDDACYAATGLATVRLSSGSANFG